MLHEDNVMEKVKSVDAVEFTAADKKAMTHAAYAQCFFILAQVMAFPSLGVAGAMVAALCGMMPWLTKFAKEAPSKAFGMVMASLCLAPVYGKLCELVVHAIQELELMGVVRVPYLLAELKERGCADESALAQVMQPGCRIGEEDLRKLAANLGLEVSELAPAPENAANTRFKAKLRGGLASFLFEYDGCFRHAEGSSHAEMLGIEQEDDIGLPSRAADAMLLEKMLYQVIARAKYMLGKIDSKFVRSEQAIEFREQLAPGIFRPGYRGFRFKEAAAGDLPTVMIDGRKFNCVASIARAHGLDPVTVRRRIADTRKAADKLSNDEWKLILAKKKVKGNPSPIWTGPTATLPSSVVSISSTPTLFTRKSKTGLIALMKSSGDR